MRLTARQIVGKMLEDHAFSGGPRAGSPDDPWRQTTNPVVLPFGPRPGAPPEPDSEALPPEEPEPTANPLEQVPPPPPMNSPKVHPRFKWRPPTPPGL